MTTTQELTNLLKRTQHALELTLDRHLQAVGLTPAQYTALRALDEDAKLSNAELARRCFVTAQTMHRVVGLLEHNGLVTRKAHPAHGRIQELSITRKGRTAMTKARKVVDGVEATAFADLSDRDGRTVTRVLQRSLGVLVEG